MNMSYCRYRNTLLDLQDCWDAMQGEYSDEEGELSEEEAEACQQLIALCQKIADYDESHL